MVKDVGKTKGQKMKSDRNEFVFWIAIILISAVIVVAGKAWGATEKCSWTTCIRETCTKLGVGEFGTEFVKFARDETGNPGETVILECVEGHDPKTKDFEVVPQMAGSIKTGVK